MEFEYVQHTFDVFSDSEDTAQKVRELCEKCRDLILSKPSTASYAVCAAGDVSSVVAASRDEQDGSGDIHDRLPGLDSTSSPCKGLEKHMAPAGAASTDDSDSANKILFSVVSITSELEVITGRYMTQPTLLYPYIDSLVDEPFDILRSFIQLPFDYCIAVLTAGPEGRQHAARVALEHVCYHIYNISKVVGVRRIISCTPNDVRFLVPVTVMIEHLHQQVSIYSNSRYECKRWCLEYVLFVWLSLLVYMPFDLSSIWRDEVDGTVTFQSRIISVSMHYLKQSTKVRDAAAIVLSTLYARPDVRDSELSTLMLYCTRVLTHASKVGAGASAGIADTASLSSSSFGKCPTIEGSNRAAQPNYMNGSKAHGVVADHSDDLFATPPGSDIRVSSAPPVCDVPKDRATSIVTDIHSDEPFSTDTADLNEHSQIGVLTILKQMLKRMCRGDLFKHIPHLSKCLLDPEWSPTSSECRKLKASCLGRLAVHLLPSQNYSHHYRHRFRQLCEDSAEPVLIPPLSGSFALDNRIEYIVEYLLSALVDDDIRVRWASAKSIGRIAVKLPVELNEQIVDHILQIISLQFDSASMCFLKGEAPVHGACLALAEIIRGGILHPNMLTRVLDSVVLTLGFDVWRGKGSAGTAVRDASCYICWAVVRNFATSLLQPSYLIPMSKELVNMAVFDMSINCRRAAGAAIQELVGRVGNIPHGLDLIVLADYYSLANRRNAFLNVSFEISKLGFYTLSMIDNLVKTKLHHPDVTTRHLAATALGKISLALVDSPNSQLVTRKGCPVYLELVSSCVSAVTSSTLGVMHGSLCALAQILSGIADHGELIVGQFSSISDIPVVFERKRLFRWKGGTMIREAICNLIKYICRITTRNVCLSLSPETLDVYIAILKDCVRHFTLDVQVAGVEALDELFCLLLSTSAPSASALVDYLLSSLQNRKDHIAARRGYALALGACPIHLMPDVLDPVLIGLCEALVTNYDSFRIKDAQTRQHAILSLIRVLGRPINAPLSGAIIERLVSALEFGCNDFEVDSRGDVGSWVREVSVEAIVYIHSLRRFNGDALDGAVVLRHLNADHVIRLVKCLIGACLESMDNTRARATFLFTHMFEGSFHFDVAWVWQRVFYSFCYEYDIARRGVVPESYSDIKSVIDCMCKNLMEVASIATGSANVYPNSPVPSQNVGAHVPECEVRQTLQASKTMKYDSDSRMSVDDDTRSYMDISAGDVGNISPHSRCVDLAASTALGSASSDAMALLCLIAQNIYWSVSNSYNLLEIIDNALPDSMSCPETLIKSQSNASLRLPGYSVAPQCFEHFLWLLYTPEFSYIVTTALIQVLGGIPLQQSFNGRTLEQVVVDFIDANADFEAPTSSGESMKLKDLLMSHVLCVYRAAIAGKNCKLCIRVVTGVRVLVSHGVISYSSEFLDLLRTEPKATSNYNYLKCIVKCLQALYTTTSDKAIARSILRLLLGFLDHQYPTIRFFTQSSLVLVFNDSDVIHNRATLDSALDVLGSSALEGHASSVAVIDRLTSIFNL